MARKTAYRSSDHIELLEERAQIIAVLFDTGREGGLVFARRLVDALRQAMSDSSRAIACGAAWFPEETVSAERLYRLASERDENTV